MIQVPEGETALLSLAPFQFGSTFPGQFLDPATGGYSSLKGSSPFKSLEKVPLNSGGSADLSQYPARSGFDDLVITGNKPKSGIGWAAVVLPHSGYLWYSLKKTVDFPLTILWFSNGGYHPSPWNGSLKRVVAVEETSGIPQGLFESVSPNIFQNRGIKTFENLSSKSPRILRHVQGICEIPRHFGKVKSVDFSQDKIIFIDLNGKKTSTLFNSDFLEL
jgi:hypothetical protein